MSERAGGPLGLEDRRDVLECLAVAVAQQAVVTDTGQEDIDVAIGIEVGRGHAQAGVIARQARTRPRHPRIGRPLYSRSKASRIPFGPDHGRGQKQVELAVAVGVESGGGRAEAGADAADDRARCPVKSDGLTHRSPSASLTRAAGRPRNSVGPPWFVVATWPGEETG